MIIKGIYVYLLRERERERVWVRYLFKRFYFLIGRFVDILRENGELGDIKECFFC